MIVYLLALNIQQSMSIIVELYVSEKERKKTMKDFSAYFTRETCEEIERGIYEYTQKYCMDSVNYRLIAQAIYKDNRKNLLFNFEQNNQTVKKLKKDILNGRRDPYQLAFLRPEDLDRDKWIRIMMRKALTEDKLNNLPTITWKPCYRCKNVEYSKYQLQTRSIDEPMTIFYICKQCGKQYSINN
jgi:DNA-directed RNA polymerase subunit M/transcription elongation factor TFIIS